MGNFFQKVYEAVKTIPRGKVCSYGQVALMTGHPGAARQVGWALSSLPTKNDVPWHRVINAQGRVSLKGRGEIADVQKLILESEGVVFDINDKVDMEEFQFLP